VPPLTATARSGVTSTSAQAITSLWLGSLVVQRTEEAAHCDALLMYGRRLLYVGLGLSSLLVLRGPAGFSFGDLLIILATGCAVMSQRKPPGQPLPLLWPIAVLLVAGSTVAASISGNPSESLTVGARLLYLILVLPWTMMMLLHTRRHTARAFAWWVGGAAVCAAGAVAQLVFGDVIPGTSITSASRFPGFTENVSDLGGIAAAGAAGALIAIGRGITRRARMWSLIALLTCFVGLVLSGSVSGMAAALAALVVVLVRRAGRIRRALVVVALGAATMSWVLDRLAAAGGLTPLERLQQALGLRGTAELNTTASRERAADRAWVNIEEHWFTGMGMAPADNVLSAIGNSTVHNLFLAAWHAGGLLTLIAVVIATANTARAGWRRTPNNPVREALVAAAVAAFVFAQTAPSFINRYYWVPMVLLVAVELLTRRDTDSGEKPGVLPQDDLVEIAGPSRAGPRAQPPDAGRSL
jgi:hypothetical protein